MKNSRQALWLILPSQLIFLFTSFIEPPKSLVTTIVRVVLPVILIAIIGLMLAGYIQAGKDKK